MKKIVVFSGGTGSIALQTGLHQIYGDSIQVDVIISAYDNGKSTGECRKVFNGKILGPSDLRKNQLTQYILKNNITDTSKVDDKVLLYQLFEERFTMPDWKSAYTYVKDRITHTFRQIQDLGQDVEGYNRKQEILENLVEFFFFYPYAGIEKQLRKTIPTTSFADFSVSNLFYASAAAINGNSLGMAGSLMSEILDIPNNVHLISDINLYLYAETKHGAVISDEGIIVAWNHPEDPIINVSLLDEKGNKYIPSIDENNMTDTSCKDLIENADIIIYSSGTQWSSLIPTYLHNGVKDALKKSNAKKYLVMNNVPDKDMKGLSAFDLLNTVERFISLDDTTIVLNKNAESSMSSLPEDCHFHTLSDELSEVESKKHDAHKLSYCIMSNYYKDYLNAKYYFFDFDDTLWSSSKDQKQRLISEENLKIVFAGFVDNCIIISGNSSIHFDTLRDKFGKAQELSKNKSKSISIYCNGGNCLYHIENGNFNYIRNLCSDFNLNDDYYTLSENILKVLNRSGWNLNLSNFENRGNCILSIKPLQEREKARIIIEEVIRDLFGKEKLKYTPYINGNTTIDIMNSSYNKRMCASLVTKSLGLKYEDIVYVGDKTDRGNDACLVNMGFRILSVNDVVEFNSFAKTYLINKQ